MRKHSKTRAFRILSFLVCLAVTTAASGINTLAVASTQETSVTCPYSECSENLMISGPYAMGDTVDSSIPYIGGRTYEDIYENIYQSSAWYMTEAHLYVIYCPDYVQNEDFSLNHSLTLIYPKHGFSVVNYEQYSGTYHYTNYICDHNENSATTGGYGLTQALCGSNAMIPSADLRYLMGEYNVGCGKTMRAVEKHEWVYGEWSISDTQHQRTKTCSLCGYSTVETGEHSLEYGEWEKYLVKPGINSNVDHRRTVSCSECGYSYYEYESHNFVRDFEGFIPSPSTIFLPERYHYYSEHCSACGYLFDHYATHYYLRNKNRYTDISETQHHVEQNCHYCDWLNEFDENHTFTTTKESVSETQHKFTSSCVCGHTIISYGDHHDDDSDCYCDDCGYLMTRFSVTVPATLSLVMDKDGNVYTPTNAVISNNSTAAVKVTGIGLSPKNGWTVVPYSTNMANQKVDSHKIGLKLRDSQSVSGNTMPVTGNWNISKGSNLPLTYSAVVSATSQPISGTNVLDVTFVIDWRD